MKELEPKLEKKKIRVALTHEFRGVNYLKSYKMQDNPYYNNLSYTLLIFYQTIIEHKEPSMENTRRMSKELIKKG